ncbi:MAG: hypothetical protein FJX76_17685 [Armatimonadetes bacterium]|nr:hypothetical protein [Armatimonadota bacterium]
MNIARNSSFQDARRSARFFVLVGIALWAMAAACLAAPPLPNLPPVKVPKAKSPAQPAAPEQKPDAKSKAAKVQDYNVKMTADVLKYDDKKKILTLDGNVTFIHEDTTLTSPHAVFETEKQVGHFTGGVKMTQPGTTVTGDVLDAYYAERRAELTGSVQMVTEKAAGKGPAPKPAARGPAKTSPTIVMTDKIVYYWDRDEADAIGNVKVRQEDRRAFSDRAHYTGAIHQIRLFSNVRFERDPDDVMVAEEAIIDTQAETFTAQGDVDATVWIERTPSAPKPLKTPDGDRVMKPAPPVVEDKPAPNGLPGDLIESPGTK